MVSPAYDLRMPLLTSREVISRTGWTRSWISSLFKRGKIEGRKDESGDLLIDEQSLIDYLNAPRDTGGRPPKKRRKPTNKQS